MPFAFVAVGLLMIVTGARDTYAAFGKQVVGDFTGGSNFLYWILAIGSVGALGYVPALQGFSRGFLALIIVAMVIRNGGVFDEITAAIKNGPAQSVDIAADATPTANAANADSANNFLTAVTAFQTASGSLAAIEAAF